ncbi:MAG: hypothetical protein MUP11_10395 [Anaerolineales bacterium]|nr:hypothetical protein [Anaerolineales bacterium]
MNKKILITLGLISLLYFLIFLLPNNAGAENLEMISIFEPDEFAQYPHLIKMLEFRGDTLRHKTWNFVAYQHYYYGFPFYAYSALWLLPVKWISSLANVQLNMLLLRQFVSVLPMITTFCLMVYIQTSFEEFWKSVLLFGFLLSIPMVIKNNLWWHPDSLAILFCVLVFLFLKRDGLEFKENFYFAAIAVGLATGTKMLGWFFFLTIPLYLIIGILEHKINWLELIKKAVIFLLIMSLTILISNPALIHPLDRAQYLKIQKAQSAAMSFGWNVSYQKGPSSWFDIINEYYGHWIFLILLAVSLGIGVINKKTRLTNILILSWIIPMLVYILFFVAIKPKHLLLPIAIPFYSSLVNIIPNRENFQSNRMKAVSIFIPLLILLFQFGSNLNWDYQQLKNTSTREESHPALAFYSRLESSIFDCLPDDYHITVFRDVRAYVPSTPTREVIMNWEIVDYEYMERLNPDVIVLQQQKINDYTKPDIVNSAQDKNQMQRTFDFYSDARQNELNNYKFLFEDDYGAVFIQGDLSELIDCGRP